MGNAKNYHEFMVLFRPDIDVPNAKYEPWKITLDLNSVIAFFEDVEETVIVSMGNSIAYKLDVSYKYFKQLMEKEVNQKVTFQINNQ